MARKKVAVILSGCGFMDGAEIHEATLTLLALDLAGADVTIAAPDAGQARVVDHGTGKETGEKRNVLAESARIARGAIVPVSRLRAADFDAVVLPGGYGAALNLSNFAKSGADLAVEPSVAAFLKEAKAAGRTLAALCIAPPILARVLKDAGVRGARLTIGNDPGTAAAIEALGQTHVACAADSCVVDRENRVVTTPAYMTAGGIAELWKGVEKAVNAVLDL
jgi:enhancing lycopene biosynthesis protein 2